MKALIATLVVCLLGFQAVLAGEVTEADKKWVAVVEKMVSEGQTTFSTQSPERVQLAKQVAGKLGRKCDVTQGVDGYRIVLTLATADSGK